MSVKITHSFLLYSSLLLSFYYLVSTKYTGLKFRWFVKGLSIILLSVFAYFNCNESIASFLCISLLFSSLGDMFLAYNDEKFFIQGLITFLISHLIYSFLFFSNFSYHSLSIPSHIIISFIILTHAFFMLKILIPKLNHLKFPVLIYMTALIIMGFGAIYSNYSNPLLFLGALLFIISDSVLAIQKFLGNFRGANQIIWITYYIAQIFILLSFI